MTSTPIAFLRGLVATRSHRLLESNTPKNRLRLVQWPLLLCVIGLAQAAFAGTVTITSPFNGSMTNSSVHVHATYSGGTGTASYMKLWIDHNALTVQHSTSVFDTSISLGNGSHLIEVQALDPSGAFYVSAAQITVATLAVNPPSSSLPPGGTQQFTFSDSASSSVTWSATGGSISSGGLYTAGATTGTFSVTAADSSGNKTTATMTIAPVHTVTIEKPAKGSTVSSPVLVHATYNGTVVATYMKIWVDHVAGLVQRNTNSFTTSVYLSSGGHLIEVQALDPSTGQVYTTPANITVSGGGGGGGGSGSLNYTTWKNDNLRTGQQLNETILTPSNVNSTHFGVLYSNTLDGAVFAQPLYVSGLSIGGGTHNVVFVATESNSVYAIDADNFDANKHGIVYWHKVLMPAGATPVPQSKVGSTIYPHIGITGTPVIDPVARILYVVTETLESSTEVFRLHALSLTTGSEQNGGPVGITVSGFQPKEQLQRPGLLLAFGNLYIAFGSQGDNQPYHGWIFSYNPSTLARNNVWNSSATGKEDAIWMGGSGIAAAKDSDGSAYIYVMTSNGDWDGVSNFGESFVKLRSDLTAVHDYFTPYQQATFSSKDQDIGSGGLLLLPPQPGSVPNEIVGCGKPLAIYLLDRDNMGRFQSNTNSQIVQEVDKAVGGGAGHQSPDACFMTPAYWQGNLYFGANNDHLKKFKLYLDSSDNKTKICASSTCSISTSNHVFGFPGTNPVVSANGSSNGIVWAVEYSPVTTSTVKSNAVLYAYDAKSLGTGPLYQSPGLGSAAKFVVPTVVNGKVYVGTASALYAFASH